MLHLAGIPVTVDDAGWLVAELYRNAYPDAVSAALVIETSVDNGRFAAALTRPERRAILGALEDPPDSLLELRAALVHEVA